MRLLLDTHALLWFALKPEKLSQRALDSFRQAESVAYSTVNFWEIGLKLGGGGYSDLELPPDWDSALVGLCITNSVVEIPIRTAHCKTIATLPFYHSDPFDRMLVAQSINENYTLLSSDTTLDAYGVVRIW